MSGSPHINVPHADTQADDFDPVVKLPSHFQEYLKAADDSRAAMEPVLQQACALLDKIVLRTAALPQPE
jgi:hypothetical protein